MGPEPRSEQNPGRAHLWSPGSTAHCLLSQPSEQLHNARALAIPPGV